MEGRAVSRFVIICMAALLRGCQNSPENNQTAAENVSEEVFAKVSEEIIEKGLPVIPEEEEAAEEEPMLYPAADYDCPPRDTAGYVESDREKVFETRCVESVVDESDPDTYKVIRTEKEITVTEEVPSEYSDANGHVIYAYSEGRWYGYKYSTGDITLGEPDEETALFFLNLDGFYDGYEIFSVECTEVPNDSMGTQYKYHVLYCKTYAMEGAPEDTKGLTVSRTRTVTSLGTEVVEEKVPILLEEEVSTDEYVYYGWQRLDDGLYYFDENGEKVTGSQIIRGIQYTFDEDGVKISDNGIHVSERNGVIDWKQVKDAKIDYAVIRGAYRGCGKGELVRDSRLEENVHGARQEGIDVSLAVYSQAVTEDEAREEAALALELAGEHQISRPLVIVSSYGGPEYRGRADSLSAADRTALVSSFCETVRNAGYTPMICAEKSWLEYCLDAKALEAYPVCIIQYNSNVTYTGPYEVWQYTAKGSIDGISGNIGLNISRRK